jgi:hypothetical protein
MSIKIVTGWLTNMFLSSRRSMDYELLVPKRERGKGERRKEGKRIKDGWMDGWMDGRKIER